MKSAREIAKEISNKAREFNSFNDVEEFVYDAIQSERTAYNALLEKLEFVRAERDDLKKRVDSEYNEGVMAVVRYVAYCDIEDEITAEAILKLRRVS